MLNPPEFAIAAASDERYSATCDGLGRVSRISFLTQVLPPSFPYVQTKLVYRTSILAQIFSTCCLCASKQCQLTSSF